MDGSRDELSLDAVVERLQTLREGAGQPSFGEIALGVSRVRCSRGVTAAMARVGRTTVYDAFRTGRRRLDSDLVGDIVRALGGGDVLAADLMAQCRAAQVSTTTASRPDESAAGTPEPDQGAVTKRRSPARHVIVAILVGCVAVNLLGRGLVDLLGLRLYLDMVGTAFAAIVLGPWWGALVGVTTNVSATATSGPDSVWFAPVNVVGALVWGYGARRWRMATSIPRFFVLNVVTAICCTTVAVTTIVGQLGGFTGHGSDDITASVLELGRSLWVSVSVSNLLTSVSDKLISGFIALAVVEALPVGMRPWVPSTWMGREPEHHMTVRACSESPEPV